MSADSFDGPEGFELVIVQAGVKKPITERVEALRIEVDRIEEAIERLESHFDIETHPVVRVSRMFHYSLMMVV